MTSIVFVLAAYLLGSISFAVLMSWLFHLPDPRSYGSKNPGATNVLRTGKKLAAVLTLLGDAAKGWLAVWLALRFADQYGLGTWDIAAVALAVFLGHLFPVFFRFQGGKGVATALGVLLAFQVWLGLAVLATWLVMALTFRISSLSALVASLLAPLYCVIWFSWDHGYSAMTLVMSLLLVWRHAENIRKLIRGEEGGIASSSDAEVKG